MMVSLDEKRARFKKLAEKRVDSALDKLRLISNLADRANYDFSDEDARKIVKHLRDGVAEIEAHFKRSKGGRTKTKFKL